MHNMEQVEFGGRDGTGGGERFVLKWHEVVTKRFNAQSCPFSHSSQQTSQQTHSLVRVSHTHRSVRREANLNAHKYQVFKNRQPTPHNSNHRVSKRVCVRLSRRFALAGCLDVVENIPRRGAQASRSSQVERVITTLDVVPFHTSIWPCDAHGCC